MRLGTMGARLSLAAFVAFAPAMIPAAAQAEDCVRVVRSISDFTIQGDAWTWWAHASGRYAQSLQPAVGSVLVFKRSGRLNRGHVSLVSRIVDRRTIEVDHSWLGGRGLRRAMRVVDVSAHNDWSAVRVWHEPGDTLGMRSYATYGFILPDGARPQTVDPQPRVVVAPAGRAARATVRLQTAQLEAPRVTPTVRPAHKPSALLTTVAQNDTAPLSITPRRKPSTPAIAVAGVDSLRTLLPARKPGGAPATEVASSER
ncbi:MAG TPA: CHAP domain-containing protein [Azospirillum sp.]|nr:CHAP domain-containing protein [Azospirillum sp.]